MISYIFKKKIFFISCISLFFLLFSFCIYEEGNAKNIHYDDGYSYEGWEKISGRWIYKDANGNTVTGWQFLPVKSGSDRYKWFFFDKNGFLFVDKAILAPDSDSKYTSFIDHYAPGEVDYEPGVLKQGWYDFSSWEDIVFLKKEGLNEGEYSLCSFSDGKWVPFSNYKRENDSGNQKWSIIRTEKGVYIFVNTYTGLVLEIEAGNIVSQSIYNEDSNQKMIVREKLVDRPEFYGAVGDGVSDDTKAIRYALEFSRDIVFSNRYNTTEPIYINNDGTHLTGNKGVIVTHPEFQTFRLRGKNVIFDSLIFKGEYGKNESSDNSCIFIKTEKEDASEFNFNTLIKNCSFIDTGLRGVHIHSERVSDTDYTPVSIAKNITIRDCEFDTYKIGVCCSGPDGVSVENCLFKNAFFEHVTFDWGTRYSVVKNSLFEGSESGVGCIGLDGAQDCSVEDNIFYYSKYYGITLNNESGTNKNILIEGNTFNDAGGEGGIRFREELMYGVSAEDVKIIDNVFDSDDSVPVVVKSSGGMIEFLGNEYKSGTPVIYPGVGKIISDF